MGFCEKTPVQIISKTGAILCHVCGVKIGLSAELARHIYVSPLAA
jgi:hypothetical protein